MNQVEIYTDGACKGNPGPGGWGVLLRSGTLEKELFGGELGTTNNRMELMAVIEALTALKRPCAVTLFLDLPFLFVFLAVMFWYSWQLSLIAVATVLLLAILSIRAGTQA